MRYGIVSRTGPTGEQGPDGQPEHPADLYLHKIVQTTVPLPALSRFDTETYLVLLQLGGATRCRPSRAVHRTLRGLAP